MQFLVQSPRVWGGRKAYRKEATLFLTSFYAFLVWAFLEPEWSSR